MGVELAICVISYSSDLDFLQLLYFAVDGGLEMWGFPVCLSCRLHHVCMSGCRLL